MTGNSTWGRGATGRKRYARPPASSSATLSSEVPTGRRMKGAEMFTADPRPCALGGLGGDRAARAGATGPPGETVEREVDDGGGVEGEELGEEEAADDGDAEGAAQLGAGAGAEGEGKAAEEGGHGGHHDGTEAEQASLEDGLMRRQALGALGIQGEVDHHDGILLDDANEQDDADEGDDAEVDAAEEEREDGADTGGGQGGEDGDGVDVALVEDAEDDVHGDEGGEDEEGLVREGGLEGLGGALEAGVDGGGQPDLALGGLDGADGMAGGDAGGEVEGEGDSGELALVVDGEGGGAGLDVTEGGERDLGAGGGLDVDGLEGVGVLLEPGGDLEDDVVLVELGEDGGDLALAEGVVQGVVDGLGEDAETGGGVAVDDERGLEAAVLLIGGDIAQPRQGPQLGQHPRSNGIDLGEIRAQALQRVLELGIALPAADAKVLHGLQIQRRAGNMGQLPAQAADGLV